MLTTWPYAAAAAPLEHQQQLEPGETRQRLARTKYKEEIIMYLHIREPEIKAKTTRMLDEALLGEQIRLARNGQPGRIGIITASIRRSIGTLLITAGERLQPADLNSPAKNRPKTAMQA